MANQPARIAPDFDLIGEVSRIVTEATGVQLGTPQEAMIRSRLSRRMAELGLSTDEQYLAYLQAHRRTEAEALVSLLTTHHTYFFREFSHFEYLGKTGLPAIVAAVRAKGRKVIRVWSAASSRGQEAYSLAMFLSRHLPAIAPEMSFEIVGSDIDPESVAMARNAVYPWAEIKRVPQGYLGDHWVRGTGEISEFVKARASLKKSCRFEVENLLDLAAPPPGAPGFDVIFCRNVFIYFTPSSIQSAVRSLMRRLEPHGLLFVGLSESLRGLDLPAASLGHSIFAHPSAQAASIEPVKAGAKPAAPPLLSLVEEAPEKPLRVVCVDDSPTVIALLKKILVPEHGFQVVATAANGIEARKAVAAHQADLMTLDIHMPERTGVEYLEQDFRAGHPPVVMISSVARENAELALRCLELGASDYVEKPALANLEERGDEIRAKLLCAHAQRGAGSAPAALVEPRAGKSVSHSDPSSKLRVFLSGSGKAEQRKLLWLLKSWSAPGQPAVLVLLEGADSILPALAQGLSSTPFGAPEVVAAPAEGWKPQDGKLYLMSARPALKALEAFAPGRKSTWMVLSELSLSLAHRLHEIYAKSEARRSGSFQLLMDDSLARDSRSSSGNALQLIGPLLSDLTPSTSMGYLSDEHLGGSDE